MTEASIGVECLYEDRDFNFKLQRTAFEGLIRPLVERIEGPMRQVVQEGGFASFADIHAIEVVGGSTRIALLKRTIAEIAGVFGADKPNYGLFTTLNADEAVARGCALQAAILSSRFKVKEFFIQDVTQYPIRVSWEPSANTPSAGAAAEDNEETNGAADEASAASSSSTPGLVLFKRGDVFPSTTVKRVTFRKTSDFLFTASYDDSTPSAFNLLPAGADRVIAPYTVHIPAGTVKNVESNPAVRVNVRINKNGMFEVASAQLVEQVPQEVSPIPAVAGEGKEGEGKESGADAASGDAAVVSKPKYMKTDLRWTAHNFGLTRQQINEAIEKEANMANQDRVLRETADKRNELESYIFNMRDKVNGSLEAFSTDAERRQLSSMLESAENWLYSDEGYEGTKATYAKKLDELTSLGGRIERRQWEAENRPAEQAKLEEMMQQYRQWSSAIDGDANLAHITYEDKVALRNILDEAQSWIYDNQGAQSDAGNDKDAVYNVDMIRRKMKEVRDAANVIVNKPKPKPVAPKAEEKAPETPTPANNGEGKEEGAGGDASPQPEAGAADNKSMEVEGEEKKADVPEPMEECE